MSPFAAEAGSNGNGVDLLRQTHSRLPCSSKLRNKRGYHLALSATATGLTPAI